MNKSQQSKTIERLLLTSHTRSFLESQIMTKGKCPLLEIADIENNGKAKFYEVKKVITNQEYAPFSVVDVSEVINPGKVYDVVKVEIHIPNIIKQPGLFSAFLVGSKGE